jgi:hypothetical protein
LKNFHPYNFSLLIFTERLGFEPKTDFHLQLFSKEVASPMAVFPKAIMRSTDYSGLHNC